MGMSIFSVWFSPHLNVTVSEVAQLVPVPNPTCRTLLTFTCPPWGAHSHSGVWI